MEVIIISWIGSALISIYISNKAGIYYLNKLNMDWEQVFKNLQESILSEIKKHTHH